MITTHPDGDQYETVQELVDELEIGLEVEFEFANREWAILPWYGGYCVYEKENEESYREYPTIGEMLDSYEIAGRRLRDVVTEIMITGH